MPQARKWTIGGLAAVVVLRHRRRRGLPVQRRAVASSAAASSSHAPAASTTPTASATPSVSSSAAAVPSPLTTAPTRPARRPPARWACRRRRPTYKATYQATIDTNRGNIVINLLNSKATCTVNSFVYLAAKNFFSNTHCHRLTTAESTCCSAATRPGPAAAAPVTSSATRT